MGDPDFARIKRNVSRMLQLNAPEADIDAYVSSEGVTAEQLRAESKIAPAPMQSAPAYDAMGNATGYEESVPTPRPTSYLEQIGNAAGLIGRGADNLVRQAADGMTFGLADKFSAGMGWAIGGPSYVEALKAERARTEGFQKEYPTAALAAQVGGGVLTGAGLAKAGLSLSPALKDAGLLPRIAGMGAEGAAYGAATGAGHTDAGNLSDYLKNAEQGAIGGGLVGAALPVVAAGIGIASRLAGAMKEPVPGISRGTSALLQATSDADNLTRLRSLGPQAMLADAGPSMTGLAQGAAAKPGAGRTAIIEALTTRDAGRNARLSDDVTRNLGLPQSPVAATQSILDARRAITSPLYEKALEDAPPVDTLYVIGQINARLKTAEGAEKAALMRAREMLTDERPNGATFDVLKSDAGRLHNIKGELDNLIDYGDPGLGVPAGALNREQGSVKAVRRVLNEALEDQVPGYRAANAKSREYAKLAESIETGAAVLGGGKSAVWPKDLEAKWAALTPTEQDALRLGMRGDIENTVGTQANDLAALRKKLGGEDDWNRLKMAIVFGEMPTQSVANAIGREQHFAQTFSDVARNSQTASRSASSAMIDQTGDGMPLATTATGLVAETVRRVARALVGQAQGARADAIREELGRVLTATGNERDGLIEAMIRRRNLGRDTAQRIRELGSNPAATNALIQALK